MVRQCAWCLRLIDSAGERLSSIPVPKLYEASHGICGVCGIQWMEQVIEADELQEISTRLAASTKGSGSSWGLQEESCHESVTQMVLHLQESAPDSSTTPLYRQPRKLHVH